MHGQFYSQQHYAAQQGRVPNAQASSGARNLSDLGQQSHLSAHYVNQHAAAVNGQGFQAHLPQQRIQQLPHHLAQQQYNQLLQNHSYQTLYNQTALQNQVQQLQATQRASQQAQQQQAILQRQQQSVQEAASLRTLLTANSYHNALLNQFGLNHTPVAAQHVPNNRRTSEHGQPSSKSSSQSQLTLQTSEQQQARVNLLRDPPPNRRATPQSLSTPHRSVHIPNSRPQGTTGQSLANQDLLRHLSPTAHARPTSFQSISPNLYQNVLLSPEMQSPSGIISPHRSAYSPSVSHLGHLPPGRIQATPLQMTRTEISTVTEQFPNFAAAQATPRQELYSPPQKPTTSGSMVNATACVKRQTPSVNSNSATVFVISDSEDEDDQHTHQEPLKKGKGAAAAASNQGSSQDFTPEVIDDDIEIIGVKQAEIMSHMRSDCPIHPFKKIDVVDVGPQEQNASRCSKCYCYVCDKLASQCSSWTIPTFPHCNAHSRASCWKARRNTKKSPLMLKLSPEDITPEIDKAGEIAMQHMIKIREAYITYRAGTPCEYNQVPCNCLCHRSSRLHDPCMHCKAVHDQKKKFNYEPVREVALGIIREIQQNFAMTQPGSALVMLEAVLSELCAHRPADFNHNTKMPSNPDTRCQCNTPHIMEQYIEKEMIAILSRHEVSKTLRDSLVKCVEEAIKPLQLKDVLKKFLTMRHWDDLLLRAVLSGSNVTGSKSRDALRETAEVIKLRVDKLDQQRRYQSIIRYLNAVKVYQGSKATISGVPFDVIMEQWKMYYTAKQGHFKEVILRLTEQRMGSPNCVLAGMPPDFLIKLLNALSGFDVSPETRLDSFDSTRARGPYAIEGKDAEVLLLVFEYILDQNSPACNNIPCYLWLAKWVNRTPLAPCTDPMMIRLWVGQATSIIEQAQKAGMQRQWHSALMHCQVHDPHVHLFTACMNILSVVSKPQNQVHPDHIQAIIDCYKNNEWALFHLLTQDVLMNFGDTKIIKWISNYARNNNGVLAQVNDKVLFDATQSYSLDNVMELMKSFIKPSWTNSIEKIQKTVIMLAAEFAARLMNEASKLENIKNDTKVLLPYSQWLEDAVLQTFHDQSVVESLLRDPTIAGHMKSIAKTCSLLHPVKKNILIYKKLSPSSEWVRKSAQLIHLLRDRFLKHALTMEEVASYLELTLTVGDGKEMKIIFSMFQDKHSCSEKSDAPTSAKVVQEISVLLDADRNPNLNLQKCVMVDTARQLCCHETLSWLICTECAKKMPTGWTSVWLSLSKIGLNDTLAQLNFATVHQFRMWLQELSLKNEDDYKRLMECMQSFIQTLISVWKDTHLSIEQCRQLLFDASKAIKDPKLQRDFYLLVKGVTDTELEKQRPKIPQGALSIDEARPPPSEVQPRPPAPHPAPPPVTSPIQNVPQPRPAAPPVPEDLRPKKAPSPPKTREPEPPKPTREPAKSVPAPTPEPAAAASSEARKIPPKVHAVMSTDALFKRSSPSRPGPKSPEKSTPARPQKEHSQPFSPANPTRTKICQNCKETISCASFKCPKCQKSTRTVQPVTCPDCGQENHELKGYACQYCYRSLLPVLFGNGEESRAQKSTSAATKQPKKQSKKKNTAKKRTLSKTEEEICSSTETAEEEPNRDVVQRNTSEDHQERVQPLKVKVKVGQGHRSDLKGCNSRHSQDQRTEVKGRASHDHNDLGPGHGPTSLKGQGQKTDFKGLKVRLSADRDRFHSGEGHSAKIKVVQGRPSQDSSEKSFGRSHSNQGRPSDQGHSDVIQGHAGSSLTDSSDSDSADDFQPQPPPKKRRKQVPPIVLKRKPSGPSTNLSDDDTSDSEPEVNIRAEPMTTHQPIVRKESRDLSLKLKITGQISSDEKTPENGKVRRVSSHGSKTSRDPTTDPTNTKSVKTSIPQPQFYHRPLSVPNDSSSPQRPGLKVALTQAAPPQPAGTKRRVGHSSMMSKKQKNILSRMKKIGTVVPKGPKTTPPNAHPTKEVLRSPMQNKRPSIENGALTSPTRTSVELIRNAERQRHDSGSTASSVGSPSRSLSFTLAAVEKTLLQKAKRSPNGPRNVGVRSGGPPSSKKRDISADTHSEEGTSHRKTLFPQPLNSGYDSSGQKRKKKHKKKKGKIISQKKYDSLVSRRRAGPASKTGYKYLLKMAHRLKKQQKVLPHRRWHIPTHIKFPRQVNLSRYAVVSLAPFPRKKLARIQSLVPKYRLTDLYA